MHSTRRRFLSWLGGASLLGVARQPSLTPLSRRDPLAGLDDVHPAPLDATWDMSWTERVSGKYKAVFDSPEHGEGSALFRAVAWCEQYKEVYGAARAEMSPVVVLRHNGFYLAMNNDFWGTYDVGKRLEMRDDKGKKWAKANPIAGASAAGAPASAQAGAYSIPGFIAAGGIVLACGWSFGGAVSMVKDKDKVDRAAADAKARAMLLPGVILQPNGIFAALRAQEAGCSYILAS